VPKSIGYERVQQTSSRVRTAAETVTITFGVQGNYQQVRRLINLFELSRQFIIIDQISLSSAQDQLLSLNLRLKTIFRDIAPVATKRM